MQIAVPDALYIPVVLGSIRRNRRSHNAARVLVERIEAAGQRTSLIDLREWRLPLYDEEDETENHETVRAFRDVMARSDAAVWLSPEYNHAYTSAIKNAIDYLRTEIRHKAVAVCGLSGGAMGGVRAVEQLKLVLIELHAVPIRGSVYFSDARTLFDQDGSLLHPEVARRTDDVIAELIWYAQVLKWGRANLPIPERR